MRNRNKSNENKLTLVQRELASLVAAQQKLTLELATAQKELVILNEERDKCVENLRAAREEIVNKGPALFAADSANPVTQQRLSGEGLPKAEVNEKSGVELTVSGEVFVDQKVWVQQRAEELNLTEHEALLLSAAIEKRVAELIIANEKLIFQNGEKEKHVAELIKELVFENTEKEKRVAELIIANKEFVYQNEEREKRAAELIIANNELAFQNQEKEKRAAEKERRAAELIIANEELVFQNSEKEKRASELEEKNKEVEAAKSDIEKKTRQLELSGKYKSEFLANMSHELRTPLNSLLILSKDLSENRKKNLTDDQVECAEIIYKSGHDLLILINEVLDLSKIEAGKMTVNIESVSLKTFTEDLHRGFKYNAEQKGLKLNMRLDIALPEYILTDSQRLNQILRNLISNAIKFTEKGSVNVSLSRHSESEIIIEVADTGIGIQESNQMAVFEAFQQADGTTSRKYGGTGLGLSISREFAKLLGAEISLCSVLGEGSTFKVILPIDVRSAQQQVIDKDSLLKAMEISRAQPALSDQYVNYPSIPDNRDSISAEDNVVLVIEKDMKFADILLKLANTKGFKCLSAATGEDGILLARKYRPRAIILDMSLPGMTAHEFLLELKVDPDLRQIPVHILSGDGGARDYLHDGAIEFLMKPVNKTQMEWTFDKIEKSISRKIINLLIVEGDANSRKALKVLIGRENINYFEAENGRTALSQFNNNEIDCIVLDIDLPDMTGFDFIHKLEEIKGNDIPRLIIYTGVDLNREEKDKLKKYTRGIILKGAESELSILRETDLFLHRTAGLLQVAEDTKGPLQKQEAVSFHNRRILLVDDDYRNLFALSRILTERGIEIIKAENGIKALEKLDAHGEIELVLMDIMMPEMDGYEAIRRIRAQDKFARLPIIAVTAKAMNCDFQKCIDAGANDYIAKPVEIDGLLTMMSTLLA
jgi:signal transduction histidine kinase/CheY-like chemotaxis protein